jgi:hypothetical protein
VNAVPSEEVFVRLEDEGPKHRLDIPIHEDLLSDDEEPYSQ